MSEFLAAIAGAIVGGAIAYAVQMVALREARKQRAEDAEMRQKALGHALIFKMIRIYSHLRLLSIGVKQSIASAQQAGVTGQPWQCVLPVANLPDPVHFTTDEMVMLLGLKDDDLFNDLVALDERHNTTVAGFAAYKESRSKLSELLPSEMRGDVGTVEVTADQLRVIGPKLVEVNSLITALIPQCQQQEQESWEALSRLATLLTSKVGLTLKLAQKEDEELKKTVAR